MTKTLSKDAIREAREKRVREADGCDICEGVPCLVHEIARGTPHRQKALLANYATLILCQPCHDLKVHKGMPVAEQLAWLKARRAGDFDIEKFYRITARRWPSAEDIWHHYQRIMDQLLRTNQE